MIWVLRGLVAGIAWLWSRSTSSLTAAVITMAVAAGIGYAVSQLLEQLLPWLLDPAVWATWCTTIFAAFFATIYSLLPTSMQGAFVSAFAWFGSNTIIAFVWKLAWYFISIFVDTTVLTSCITTYFSVIFICLAIRLGKGVYDLWPTRG